MYFKVNFKILFFLIVIIFRNDIKFLVNGIMQTFSFFVIFTLYTLVFVILIIASY